MPYCSRCGVEVDSEVKECPLCNAPIQKIEKEPEAVQKRFPDFEPDGKPRMSERTRRNIAWEVISILCAIAVFVVGGSNLRGHATMSWSLYPIASVAAFWITSTLFIYAYRIPWLIGSGSLLTISALLAAVDWVGGGLSWFVGLYLPILGVCVLVAALLLLVAARVRFIGLNVVAFVSLGVALLCAGTDAAIERYVSGVISLSWSIIVLQALVPFAGVMLFLHFRLRSRFNLKRLFHL